MKNQNNEFNILICGSQKFDDQSFVFGILDAFYNDRDMPSIDNIITSKFSGTCEFARQWAFIANERYGANIGVKDFTFDLELENKNISLYEQIDIPDFILKNDPFFQKGKEKLIESGVKCIMPFPNREGILGVSTLNIQRFAQLAEIPSFDCPGALKMITQFRQETSEIYTPQETVVSSDPFVNRHPAKNKKF